MENPFFFDVNSQRTIKQVKGNIESSILSSNLQNSNNILPYLSSITCKPPSPPAHFFVAHRKEASRHLVATEPRSSRTREQRCLRFADLKITGFSVTRSMYTDYYYEKPDKNDLWCSKVIRDRDWLLPSHRRLNWSWSRPWACCLNMFTFMFHFFIPQFPVSWVNVEMLC